MSAEENEPIAYWLNSRPAELCPLCAQPMENPERGMCDLCWVLEMCEEPFDPEEEKHEGEI